MLPDFVGRLSALLGPAQIVADPHGLAPYVQDWRGRYSGTALCAVFPRITAEVSAVVQVCAEAGVAIVPQGGNTGMCGAATPEAGPPCIVLRLDRMNRVRSVNPLDNTMVVEAGCILADIQTAADGVDRLFPLSLGAEGSCQIGGTISTNAGGTAVLRYGPMRDLVLGIEAVLPDGRVLNKLTRLRKDNTGYALKQLFIGAEGTLGVITAAVLKLFPKPRTSAVAMATADSVENALGVLARLRGEVGDRLSAFEIISHSQYDLVFAHMDNLTSPFAAPAGWYVLIELSDTLAGIDLLAVMERILGEAIERGELEDAVVPTSEAKAQMLWRIRHSVSEANKRAGLSVSHDTAVPLDRQPEFVAETERRIRALRPDANVLFVGHIGDGNIHAIAHFGHAAFPDAAAFEGVASQINQIVDDVTIALEGSISAEHGIGISNRKRLAQIAAGPELDVMRRIKDAIDPQRLMNPGKVLMPLRSEQPVRIAAKRSRK
jgi:FAD/FMN-containing dehydrogenase